MTALLLLCVILILLFGLQRIGIGVKRQISWRMAGSIFLYILLALGVLGVIAKAWSIAVILLHLNPAWLVSPSQNPVLDILSTVIYAIALYGIWRRRKWGAYLIFVRLALTIFLQVYVYHSLHWQMTAGYTGLDNLYADFSGGATWLIAFYWMWAYFS